MSIYLQHSTRTGKQEVDICRAKGRDSKAEDGDNQVCYNESRQNVNSLTHSSSPSLSSPLDLSHIPLSLSVSTRQKKKRQIRKGVWKKQKVGWVYFFFIQIQPSTHNVQYLLRSARNVPQFNNYHATWHVSIFFLNTVNPSPFVTCKAMWGHQCCFIFLQHHDDIGVFCLHVLVVLGGYESLPTPSWQLSPRSYPDAVQTRGRGRVQVWGHHWQVSGQGGPDSFIWKRPAREYIYSGHWADLKNPPFIDLVSAAPTFCAKRIRCGSKITY